MKIKMKNTYNIECVLQNNIILEHLEHQLLWSVIKIPQGLTIEFKDSLPNIQVKSLFFFYQYLFRTCIIFV